MVRGFSGVHRLLRIWLVVELCSILYPFIGIFLVGGQEMDIFNVCFGMYLFVHVQGYGQGVVYVDDGP